MYFSLTKANQRDVYSSKSVLRVKLYKKYISYHLNFPSATVRGAKYALFFFYICFISFNMFK